ncbi:MAG: zinc ribbon domain-containing protein [Lachnospiraceae bacterium]|nr:zinc ribbon domain-containing protein [Lachnospiraceae bacterium]
MDDLIRVCLPLMVKQGFSEEQARLYMQEKLPTLDYWKR